MLRNRTYLIVLLAILLASCSPRVITNTVVRDSIVTQIRERIVRDTVSYEIPVETEKIATRDTASHLENRFGESDAVVSGGVLTHSLRTKPQTIYIPMEVPVADTTTTSSHVETIEVPVPAELTGWQKFRIGAFWYLLGGLAAALLWIFRKQLFKI